MRLQRYMESRGMGRQYGRVSRVMMELGCQEPEKGMVQAVRVARCMWGTSHGHEGVLHVEDLEG